MCGQFPVGSRVWRSAYYPNILTEVALFVGTSGRVRFLLHLITVEHLLCNKRGANDHVLILFFIFNFFKNIQSSKTFHLPQSGVISSLVIKLEKYLIIFVFG